MDNSAANTDLIRGHVITIILRSLQGNDKYGYEICREIEVKSEGSYVLKQPTLYSCLKRLESQGYITSYWGEISNGGRRRYYSLTPKGEEFLERDKQEWEFSRTLINRLLSDKDYDLTQPPPFNPSDLRPYTRKIATFQTVEEMEQQGTVTVENTSNTLDETADSTVEIEEVSNTTDESCDIVELNDSDGKELTVTPQSVEEDDVPQNVSFISPLFLKETDYTQDENTTKFRTLDEIFATQKEDDTVTLEEQQVIQTKEESSDTVVAESVVDQVIREITEPTPVVTPTPSAPTYDNQSDDINYRDAFSKLFDAEEPQKVEKIIEKPTDAEETAQTQTPTITDLKKRYYSEGYNLKQYSRSNVSIFYNMNYVYANKLSMVTYWIMYAIILVEIGLTAIFESSLNLSLGVYLGAIIGGLIIPCIPTAMTLMNPLKRTKATFDLKRSVINRLLLFLNFSLITACLGVFVWQVDLNNLSTMVKPILLPILYLLNLPLSSLVYYQVYKTKKFHLS